MWDACGFFGCLQIHKGAESICAVYVVNRYSYVSIVISILNERGTSFECIIFVIMFSHTFLHLLIIKNG